jgi:DNA-directed RNA polymerase specialized sigma24 family protein
MTAGGARPYPAGMERAEAVARLPATYAAVIEMLDEGSSDAAIAARLEIDPAAVEPLVAIARAKLARLMITTGAGPEPPAGPDGPEEREQE